MAPWIDTAIEQLRDYAKAGGTIIFGTDVGYMGDYDTTDEFLMMARAGMDFRDILTSLTTAPAERFGLSKEAGRIAPGMDADLVLLGGDPAYDVTAFSKVRLTLREGKIIYRSN